MTDNHPITPPPELVKQWVRESNHNDPLFAQVAVMAARWGADQELEACCSEMDKWGDIHYSAGWKFSKDLRYHRRPKPPSLKGQALIELEDVYNRDKIDDVTYDTIRQALEALPE